MAAIPSPGPATSCRVAEAATLARDVAEICWAGLDDRRIFDRAREASRRYEMVNGVNRFTGYASIEYQEGRSCSFTFSVPPYLPLADQVVAGLSRELGLPRVVSRFDPAALIRAYSWPAGNSAERGRSLEATLRFLRGRPNTRRCDFDQMTVTVRNSSAS